jgi:hypothetical protein
MAATKGMQLAMTIEEQYQQRIDAMSPRERVARSFALFQWMREMIGRQVQREHVEKFGVEMSTEALKWRVALRVYGSEPGVVALIERRIAELSLPIPTR